LADDSAHAESKVVDRLLISEEHAERMAMHWLDAAQYADTNGYNNDEVRTMWPWRDWVINAFHSLIDDVQVFSVRLSAAEVEQLARGQVLERLDAILAGRPNAANIKKNNCSSFMRIELTSIHPGFVNN
jgi:hypothetical protein